MKKSNQQLYLESEALRFLSNSRFGAFQLSQEEIDKQNQISHELFKKSVELRKLINND